MLRMRRATALSVGLFVAIFLSAPVEAGSILQGHAVIDEVIVPGEGRDTGRTAAYLRARLEVIEIIAAAVRAHRVSTGSAGQDLEALIADHVQIRILREVEQEEEVQRHILIEIDGRLEALEAAGTSPMAVSFRQAKDAFQRLTAKTGALREQVRQADADARADIQVQLELLGIETARLACFDVYPLAGEAYCQEYRRAGQEGYTLAATVIDCGGAAAWRLFSPFHRVAVYLSQGIEALRLQQATPAQVLWGHLEHKQRVLEAYPYLRDSHELSLFEPIDWQGPNGTSRRIPSVEWTAEMITIALQREVATWGGISHGWKILTDALSVGGCARGLPLTPALVKEIEKR